MNMIIKKNQIVTATLLVALCGAVFVNWYYSRPSSSVETGSLGEAEYVNATTVSTTAASKANSVSEYFANSELKRDNAHDKALETIEAVITNEKSSKEAVENATLELSALSETIKQEADLENIIEAKLDSECIVIINAGKAEIILENKQVNDTNIQIVKSTILEQTNIASENIAIIGAK